MIGIDRHTVSSNLGRGDVSLDKFFAIAEAVGASPEDLIKSSALQPVDAIRQGKAYGDEMSKYVLIEVRDAEGDSTELAKYFIGHSIGKLAHPSEHPLVIESLGDKAFVKFTLIAEVDDVNELMDLITGGK